MNFHFIAVILLSISENSSSFLRFTAIDCSNPFRGYVSPISCCYYPYIFVGNASMNFCSPKCAIKHGNPCCIYDCIANILKLYTNEKFNAENLLKFYENTMKESWEMASEKWMPIIKSNIAKCIKIVPPQKTAEELCTAPYYTTQILNCVTELNFINCPTFTNSKACRRLRFFIRKLDFCGEFVNGEYFIHRNHFAPQHEEDFHDFSGGKREY